MTLLTAINDVCNVVGLDTFTAIYGQDYSSAMTMLELANQAGDEISRRVDWQRMLKTDTSSSSPHNLPSDFERFIEGSAIRSSGGEFLRPVTNSGLWAIIQAASSTTPYYFVKGNSVYFSPTSTAASATLEYVSKNWVLTSSATEAAGFTADDDTTLFPERLLTKNVIWRWKRQQGLAYDDTLAEFEADLQQEINADRGIS